MHSGFWQDPLQKTYPPLDQAWHLYEGRNSSWSPFTRQDLTHSTVSVRRDLRRLRDWRTPLSIVTTLLFTSPCLRFGANHADGRGTRQGFPRARLRLDL